MKKFFSLRGKNVYSDSFMVLDIGTEAVKVLISKKEKGKRIITGASLKTFDYSGLFNNKNIEKAVLERTISETIKEAVGQADSSPNHTIISLPPGIFKARIYEQSFIRKASSKTITAKEKKEIFESIFQKAKSNITKKISETIGILPEEIFFVDLSVLRTEINGYAVSSIVGATGKKIIFNLLATFIPKGYWEDINVIIRSLNLKNKKIVHLSQTLSPCLEKYGSGIFIDIGGEVTQVFIIKNNQLQFINEFPEGGKTFIYTLSDFLGLNRRRARILLRKYSKKELSEGSQSRIKEIFTEDTTAWFNSLKQSLSMAETFLPGDIYLFGGGRLLPNIQTILEEGDWQDINMISQPKIQSVSLKDFSTSIKDKTKKTESSQYINSYLLSYGQV